MLSPDETTQTTDALENLAVETIQTAEALERLPRPFDRRNAVSERRQHILQQKQTDLLPHLATETSGSRLAWRQVTQLREENRHLRSELERVRTALGRVTEEHAVLRPEFDEEVAAIHSGHQQEVEHYQSHLHEMMEEHNRLQEQYQVLERRYEELEHSLRYEVAGKVGTEVLPGNELASDTESDVLAELKKSLALEVRREESQHLLEALHLKREVQQIYELLRQERQELEEERRRLYALQSNMREQAQYRQETLQKRFEAHRHLSLVTASLLPLAIFIVLQFVCLNLFRVNVTASVSLALLAPILAYLLWAIVSVGPGAMIMQMYRSAPHKRRVKK